MERERVSARVKEIDLHTVHAERQSAARKIASYNIVLPFFLFSFFYFLHETLCRTGGLVIFSADRGADSSRVLEQVVTSCVKFNAAYTATRVEAKRCANFRASKCRGASCCI